MFGFWAGVLNLRLHFSQLRLCRLWTAGTWRHVVFLRSFLLLSVAYSLHFRTFHIIRRSYLTLHARWSNRMAAVLL